MNIFSSVANGLLGGIHPVILSTMWRITSVALERSPIRLERFQNRVTTILMGVPTVHLQVLTITFSPAKNGTTNPVWITLVPEMIRRNSAGLCHRIRQG